MRKVVVYLLLFLVSLIVSYQQLFAVSSNQPSPQQIQASLRSLPLAFEPNGFSGNGGATYLIHRPEMNAVFSSDAVSFLLPAKNHAPTRLAMSFAGQTAPIMGEQKLTGKINYLRGNNPARWRTGISTYSRIRYTQLWPGVDLVFYGNGEKLEHDFVIAPGADSRKISFELKEVHSIELDSAGNLLVSFGDTFATFKKPVAYQETRSGRRQVAAGFKLNGTRVGFHLGRYDHHRALVIDPVLAFSTDLAGSAFERISGMAVDGQGNIYVTGDTFSTDFPTTPGSVQPACAGCSAATTDDAFVTKISPTGSALVYSTYLGGTANDLGQAIAVDNSGNAIVAGLTQSSDFPSVNPIGTCSGAAGTFCLFISSLSPTGAALNYSGAVGPLRPPVVFGAPSPAISISTPLALDSSGNAYIATETLFDTFPTTPSAIAPVPATPQVAILVALKVSPTGSLVYSTAIPGRAAAGTANPAPNTFFQNAIAVDSVGNAYIAGQANDGLPTTLGVIGPAFASDSGFNVFFPQEGFLLKLNPAGSALTYATYIPATSRVTTLRLDSGGNAYLGGATSSPSLAISPNAFSTGTGCTGCQSGFLLKVNPLATAMLGGTYLHGAPPFGTSAGAGTVAHIALDSSANLLVTGTDSGTLPTVKPLLQTFENATFILQLSSNFSSLLFSSGGPDALIEIAPSGKIILASNNGFPTTPGAFQTAPPPGRIGPFSLPNIAAVDLTVPAGAVCLNPLSLDFGNGVVAPGTTSAPQSATVTNCGNGDLHISSVTSDSPDYAASTTCALAPAGIAAGSSCTVSATYSPVDYNTGHILIADDAVQSPHQVSLTGFPKAPVVTFFPGKTLTFPETPVTTSANLDMQISGSAILATVTSMTTTGDFTVSQNCLGVLPPPIPSPIGPGTIPQPCHFTVSFVPTNTGTRLGTVIVKDTALDSPQIIQLSGLGIGAWPTPILANNLSVNVAGVAGNVASSTGNPQTLVLTGGGFSRLTTATLDGIPFDGNNRLMKLVNPQEIDLTLADNDFADVGEVAVQAITPSPGGGTATNVVTITSPIKFYESIFRDIELLPSGSLVVGPKSGLIYDAFGNVIPPVTAPNLNVPSVAVIDPAQERLVSGLVGFPNVTTLLAISDDEQFLYAQLPANNSVAQVALTSGSINFTASLGNDAALGNYNATAIRVMPGHPHTWVAALQPLGDTKPIAIKVFDDAVSRVNTVEHGNATSTFPGKLLFVGSDTTTVYSIDSTSLYRFTIDANGITLRDKTAGLGAEDFATDGTLIYLSSGAIIDPGTLANKGNFSLAPGLAVHAVTVDSATSRAIFVGDAPGQGSLVQAFDTNTLAAKGTFIMPNVSGISSVLRWSTNGLAFGGGNGVVTITRSSLTGNSALLAPFHIGAIGGAAPIGTAQVSAGSPATYNIGVLGVNGFTGPITLSCSNLPQFASCSFSSNPVNAGGGVSGGGLAIVTVSTHQASTSTAAPANVYVKPGAGFVLLTAVLSLPFALAFAGRRYRAKLLALCLLIAIIGCGGGNGSVGGPTPTPPITPTPTPSGQNTPIGIYTITLTGTSASGATRHATLQLIVL